MTETPTNAKLASKQRQEPRSPLTPLAMALAVSMARDGYTRLELAKETGVGKTSISSILQTDTHSTLNMRAKFFAYLRSRARSSLLVTEPWAKFIEILPKGIEVARLSDLPTWVSVLATHRGNNFVHAQSQFLFGAGSLYENDQDDQACITRFTELLRMAHEQHDQPVSSYNFVDDDWHKITRAFQLLVILAFSQWESRGFFPTEPNWFTMTREASQRLPKRYEKERLKELAWRNKFLK